MSVTRRADLPTATEAELAELFGSRRPAIFLDYDGVLTPIVSQPDLALISPDMRSAVRRLAEVTTVAVVSGRDLEDVRSKVGVEGIHYAGSHGFDIVGPDGRPAAPELEELFDPYLEPLADATETVEHELSHLDGVLVERKRFASAIHYRNVDRARVADVEGAVRDAASRFPNLAVTSGKEIFEFRPDLDWDKGRAVEWLIDQIGIDVERQIPVYLGDDVTDEDAFRALRATGLGVVVGTDGPDTLATFALEDCDAVRRFLTAVAELRVETDG